MLLPLKSMWLPPALSLSSQNGMVTLTRCLSSGSEGEHVELFRPRVVGGRAIGIRPDEVAVAIELDERLLTCEARPDRIEVLAGGNLRGLPHLDVPGEEVEAGAGDGHDADDRGQDEADDDQDPGADLTGHGRRPS